MTHSPDFGAETRRRKLAPIFWTGCHIDLAPVGADWRRSVAYSSVDFRRRFFVPEIGADRRRVSAPKSGLCVVGFIFQLPPKPADQGAPPPSSAPAGAYNPYSPAVVPAQHASAPAAPVNIGFENLSSTSLHCLLPTLAGSS